MSSILYVRLLYLKERGRLHIYAHTLFNAQACFLRSALTITTLVTNESTCSKLKLLISKKFKIASEIT